MIDRKARNLIAESTRHYLSGLSTNFKFDDSLFQISSDDAAIDAIRNNLWLIYDDLREHKHEGKWELSAAQREIAVRIIMFLKSDFEYTWPNVPTWYRIFRPMIWLVSIGAGTKCLDRKYYFYDNLGIWPFITQTQIEEAKCQPKYLAVAT